MAKLTKAQARQRRHKRVRSKVAGNAERPRLSVFRSGKHIYAQLIDDDQGYTLAAASSMEPAIKENKYSGNDQEAARLVGELIADRAKDKGVEEVVFDRGGYLYHGRVKALADGVREKGIKL